MSALRSIKNTVGHMFYEVNFSTQLGKAVKNAERLLPIPETLWQEFGEKLAEQFPIILFANLHGPYPQKSSCRDQ